MNRRDILGLLGSGACASLAGCPGLRAPRGTSPDPGETSDPTATPDAGAEPIPDEIDLETVATGLEAPLDIVFPPSTEHAYVATQLGGVYVMESGGIRSEPLLDLSDDVVVANERGLLGIELHPEFEMNRRLFVRYSAPSRPGTPSDYSHTFVLAEFEVAENGKQAIAGSERTILEIPQPHGVHNAGDIRFGPDGYLYVPTGDGGNHGDYGPGHVGDWYRRNPGGNGQDVTENLLGSILRIDVDREEQVRGEQRNYAIPSGNPLLDTEGLAEQYAWGFRNPWRTSFDGSTYYVADVGQALAEEINIVERGGNYGWNVKEGSHCFNSSDLSEPRESCPDRTPDDVRSGEPLIDPVMEFPNESPRPDAINGIAVVGGFVYRGRHLPGLVGRYVFGDLTPRGRLFVGTPPAMNDADSWRLDRLPLTGSATVTLNRLLSFGRNPAGDLYALGGGGVHRLVP